jgi:hypothetical protein
MWNWEKPAFWSDETGLLPVEAQRNADREAADEKVFHAGLLLRRLTLRLERTTCPKPGREKSTVCRCHAKRNNQREVMVTGGVRGWLR